MIYAYARVSTQEQSMERQTDSIRRQYPDIAQENVFLESKSGKDFNRPEYQRLKSRLQYGDELVIHELDRLGRSKRDIKQELEWLRTNGITLRILNIPSTLVAFPKGQEWAADLINNLLIEVYSTIAQQERETLIRRTEEGLAAARAKGHKLGRPQLPRAQIGLALKMYLSGDFTIKEITKATSMSRASLFKYVNDYKQEIEEID